MGDRKKLLDAAEQLLYTLEENVLPTITLSDDRDVVKKQIRDLRKLTEKERDRWVEKRLLKQDPARDTRVVPLRWEEREVQRRVRTARIPLVQIQAWCKGQGIDVTEFDGAQLQVMLTDCVATSAGWQLGYEEWKVTDYGFVDLHMPDVSAEVEVPGGSTMDGPEKVGGQ